MSLEARKSVDLLGIDLTQPAGPYEELVGFGDDDAARLAVIVGDEYAEGSQ